MREIDKLHVLYDSLMDARRQLGRRRRPFHKFAALVTSQVSKLRAAWQRGSGVPGGGEGGKVNFTVRGMKGAKD